MKKQGSLIILEIALFIILLYMAIAVSTNHNKGNLFIETLLMWYINGEFYFIKWEFCI
jgi:hypothetical protein